MTPAYILHIISFEDYIRAAGEAEYRPPSLAREGFIHFSMPEQAAGVANAFYADRGDLLLLVVDPALLGEALVYETANMPDVDDVSATGMFPHLYAPLDLSLLYAVVAYPRGTDGRYSAPRIMTADT